MTLQNFEFLILRKMKAGMEQTKNATRSTTKFTENKAGLVKVKCFHLSVPSNKPQPSQQTPGHLSGSVSHVVDLFLMRSVTQRRHVLDQHWTG
jgi:hypothetical protein